MADNKKKTRGSMEGSKKGGATTRAKFFPYEGKTVYLRVKVDKEAAEKVARIPETERSRFFTEAITNEMVRRQKGKEVA